MKPNVTIKYCVFTNNSASNNNGNDVYVPTASIFYNNSVNIVSVCSASPLPAIVVGGV
jgi:hypothetical protein